MGLDENDIGMDLDDLVQEGSIGLLNAIPLFDAGRGMKFLTYAAPAIRNAMTDCIRAALAQFEQRMVDKKDGPGFQRVYLDDVLSDDERMLRIEAIADPYTQTPEQIYIQKEQLIELYAALDKLTAREQTYLLYRYGFTDSNLNHTGIYLYSKGKIMIHLTFDYKTDEKCTTPGQYLKYHRTFQGLSTRELAEKVGIVPATLVLYENDRHPIKYSTAVALANVLGIDRNRLLDEYTAFVDYPYFSLLKKVRQDLSLTQIQMAELIGIGQTSYSGWEREIRVPRRKEYDKILAALKKLRVNVDTYLCQSASI